MSVITIPSFPSALPLPSSKSKFLSVTRKAAHEVVPAVLLRFAIAVQHGGVLLTFALARLDSLLFLRHTMFYSFCTLDTFL